MTGRKFGRESSIKACRESPRLRVKLAARESSGIAMSRLPSIAVTPKTSRLASLERALFVLWLIGVLLSPVWFGSNTSIFWALNAALFGFLLAGYGALSGIVNFPLPIPLSRLSLPLVALGGALLWAEIQTLPWVPSAWQHPVWQAVSAALAKDVAGSVSVYPAAGHAAILWTATVAASFILSIQFGHDPRRARLIAFSSVLTAGAIAGYGILIYVTGNHWVLWLPKHAYYDALTATFINRNTFAAYAGISLICALGLVLGELQRQSRESEDMEGKFFPTAVTAQLLIVILLLCAALILTGSRAGAIVTVIGIFALLSVRLGRRDTGRMLALAAGLFAVMAIAASALVLGHLLVGRLVNFDGDFAYRLAVDWRLLAAIKTSPWLGYGYGAFEQAFPVFRDASLSPNARWEYAHDDWLEALFALGIPGGLLLWLVFAWILARCLRAALGPQKTAIYGAIAFGVGAMVIIHSLVDFSLQIQGFALPLTALLGVGVAQSWSSRAT